MRFRHLFVLAAALSACAIAPSLAAPASSNQSVAYAPAVRSEMPPRRIGDCVTYVLLDNKCTADWYSCADGDRKGRCVKAWADCCTLPGNPARTTIVSSPQTP